MCDSLLYTHSSDLSHFPRTIVLAITCVYSRAGITIRIVIHDSNFLLFRHRISMELSNPIVWLTPDGKIPTDGSTLCWLVFIADPLKISCEAAIVLVMFTGFSVFAMILVVLFIFYKRK